MELQSWELFLQITGKAMPRLTHMCITTHGLRNYNGHLLSFNKGRRIIPKDMYNNSDYNKQ